MVTELRSLYFYEGYTKYILCQSESYNIHSSINTGGSGPLFPGVLPGPWAAPSGSSGCLLVYIKLITLHVHRLLPIAECRPDLFS